MTAPLLKLTEVNKSFGPIDVLFDISLDVKAGEILCLLGDNGAGKSTLIKILSGVHKATSGTVEMSGNAVVFNSPRDASDHGIATVHQFGGTFPLMSIGRSFFVGEEPKKGWGPFKRLDRKRANEIAVKAVRDLGITRIDDGDRLVGGLSGGERQALAIARAVHFGASVLILDEPTAALWGQRGGSRSAYRSASTPKGHRCHFHHPQCHPCTDCRGPFRLPHQRRQGGRFPQG